MKSVIYLSGLLLLLVAINLGGSHSSELPENPERDLISAEEQHHTEQAGEEHGLLNPDEKRARGFLGKRARGFLGKRARGFLGKRARGFLGKRARGFLGKRARGFLGKRARGFLGKRARGFLGKRARGFLGKRARGFLGKRARGFLGKRARGFLGKRARGFLGKRDEGQHEFEIPYSYYGDAEFLQHHGNNDAHAMEEIEAPWMDE